MTIFLSLIGVLIVVFFLGKWYSQRQFKQEVKQLFSGSNIPSNKIYETSQLSGLPDPVQRYFKLVLKPHQPYIGCMRATHDGLFKVGKNKDWINIHGEQYATTEKPGFIWKGTTSMFVARDMYIADKGRLVVALFSLFHVVDKMGEQYNQGELLRWLGESVMYPTNLLPGEHLHWFPIDAHHAKLSFIYKGLDLFFLFTFNSIGEITEMETKRYMSEDKLEIWVIKIADYKLISNILIPVRFEVLWRLKEGDFSYARFRMKTVEFDKPVRF